MVGNRRVVHVVIEVHHFTGGLFTIVKKYDIAKCIMCTCIL